MNQVKLSIIISLYNNADYIVECVDSVYNQSIKNESFEVIIVDDGSTDGGGDLCDHMAKSRKNMLVIHQQNSGPSGARNTGMNYAKGEYIHFVDADDVLLKKSYVFLYNNLLDSNADVIYFNFVENASANNEAIVGRIKYKGDFHDYIKNNPIRVFPWNKIFKKSFLENAKIRWEPIIYNEDTLFTWNLLKNQGVICVSTTAMYSYRTNPKSIVHNRDIDKIKRTITSLIYVNKRLTELYDYYTDCPPVIENFTYKYRVLFNRILCTPYSYKELKELFKECAKIGTKHLEQIEYLRRYDFLYHHPLLFYIFKRVIRRQYFKHNVISPYDGDFLASKL